MPSLDPILAAPPAFQLHLAAVTLASALAVALLRGRKGDARHRLLGRIWVGAIFVAGIGSFWITNVNPGHFTFLHAGAVLIMAAAAAAVLAARRGAVRTHKRIMQGLVAVALVASAVLALFPGRILHAALFGG